MNNEEKIAKMLELVLEAYKMAVGSNKDEVFTPTNQGAIISITGIQRKLGVGYPRALEIMNKLIEKEAVIEEGGRYHVLSIEKMCSALTDIFKTELPTTVATNARFTEIQESINDEFFEYKAKRHKDRVNAFKKNKDIKYNVATDLRALIEKRAEFNIDKEEILKFYDKNKSQIIDIFNLNAGSIEQDMRFIHGLDYEEKLVAGKDGKINTYIKLKPTFLKDEKDHCLFLLCVIIKILWNKSHHKKIYSYRIYKFDRAVAEDCNQEIFDAFYGDCLYNDNLLPF